jgi:hypothetical protein
MAFRFLCREWKAKEAYNETFIRVKSWGDAQRQIDQCVVATLSGLPIKQAAFARRDA